MRKLFLLLALIALVATFALPLLAQSDIGFLDFGSNDPRTGYYCLHPDGSYWVQTPYTYPYPVSLVKQWCENHGYRW